MTTTEHTPTAAKRSRTETEIEAEMERLLKDLDDTGRQWWETISGMTGFPMERRLELFREFQAGRRQVTDAWARSIERAQAGEAAGAAPGADPSGTASSPGSSTSESAAGASPRSPKSSEAALTLRTTLSPQAEVLRSPTEPEVREAVAQLGFRMAHKVHPDRVRSFFADLTRHARPPWTKGELDYAVALIPNDALLAKEVSYQRTVTPAVFAMARERLEVRAGRPFTYREACDLASASGVPLHEAFEVAHPEEQTASGSGEPMAQTPVWLLRMAVVDRLRDHYPIKHEDR